MLKVVLFGGDKRKSRTVKNKTFTIDQKINGMDNYKRFKNQGGKGRLVIEKLIIERS